MSRRAVCVLAMLSAVITGARAGAYEELPAISGPQPSEPLSHFKVLGIFGEHRNKELDPIALAADKPTLMVFVHQATRPSSDLSRVLMHYGQMRGPDKLFCAQIVLDDDLTKIEQFLKTAEAWWDVGTFLGVGMDGAEGPGSYGLNRNMQLTVIVADKGKVTANFAVLQPSLNDAPKILAEVAKLVGGELPTTQEIEFLQHPPHLLPGPPIEQARGKNTTDPKLRELICKLLKSTGNVDAVRDVAQKIEDYVGSDKRRQYELGQAAKLIIVLQYGGRAPVVDRVPDQRALFEGWMEKYSEVKP